MMEITRVIRKSGCTNREIAAGLGYSEFKFSRKLHGKRGEVFTDDDYNQMALMGVDVVELRRLLSFPDVKFAPDECAAADGAVVKER